MWSFLVFLGSVAAAIGIAVLAVMVSNTYRTKAENAGHAGIMAYLRAVPCSDEDKRDAVDLTLKGLMMCLVGLVFPPLLLIGVFPLFYGARKLLYALMGLGLVNDAESPDA
jgi:hypothetical protein